MKKENIEKKVSEKLVYACHMADRIYLMVGRHELTSLEANKKLCEIKDDIVIIDTKSISDELIKLKIASVNLINSYIRSVGWEYEKLDNNN